MSELILELDDTTGIEPGGKLLGRLRWEIVDISQKKRHIELSIGWKATSESREENQRVDGRTIDIDWNSSGVESFDFELPENPFSFKGQLISLQWFIEAALDDAIVQKEFVLSPTGETLILPVAEYEGL